MSQENVDLFRSIVEDYFAGSGESGWEAWIAGIADLMDPAIEWDASRAPMPDIAEVCHGPEAVQQWWRDWFEAWETLEFEYQLVDAGDSVVMLLDQRMRGRSTGIEVPMGKYAHVATFRNGLMTHWTYFASQPEALEAVGLTD
jgi:hypothetical protein